MACNKLRTYADSHPLGSSTRAAAGRAPVVYREKLKCLATESVPGNSFLLDKTPEARQRHYHFSEPAHTQSHRVSTL